MKVKAQTNKKLINIYIKDSKLKLITKYMNYHVLQIKNKIERSLYKLEKLTWSGVLTKHAIHKAIIFGDITYNGDPNNISDVSIDFTLGNELQVYTSIEVDSRKKPKTKSILIPEEGYTLQAGKFYLGFANEVIGSRAFAMNVWGKSSIGRLGLEIHNAGVGEPGFGCNNEQWTLELQPHQNIRIYPGQKIGQIQFTTVAGDISSYSGKYVGQRGVTASKNYKDN